MPRKQLLEVIRLVHSGEKLVPSETEFFTQSRVDRDHSSMPLSSLELWAKAMNIGKIEDGLINRYLGAPSSGQFRWGPKESAPGRLHHLEYGGDSSATALLAETALTIATVNNISPVGAGAHLVKAIYSGDVNYGGSTSADVSLPSPYVLHPHPEARFYAARPS